MRSVIVDTIGMFTVKTRHGDSEVNGMTIVESVITFRHQDLVRTHNIVKSELLAVYKNHDHQQALENAGRMMQLTQVNQSVTLASAGRGTRQ